MFSTLHVHVNNYMLYMKYHNFKKVKDYWKILRVINNFGLTKNHE